MHNKRLLDYQKLKFEIRDTMRYDDVGDYFDHTIVAYDTGDEIVNNAILLHEFIEYTMIKSAGIDPELIDRFDTDPDAQASFPKEYEYYTRYHRLANMVEKQFVENLGLTWEKHQEKVYTTPVKVKKAIQSVTDQLHVKDPSEEQIEKSRKIVGDAFDKKE